MTEPGAVRPRLTEADHVAVDSIVAPADEALRQRYPGDDPARQPVHTVYVPADKVSPDLASGWGDAARAALEYDAPSPLDMAAILGIAPEAVVGAWPLMLAKLEREPVEDLRIDLEDGYGARMDDEEDSDVVEAVTGMARAAAVGAAPPYWGIRFKSLEASTRARGLRTLDLAIGSALAIGPLPPGFVVTLPKVTSVEQVVGMVDACQRLERAYDLGAGRLTFEVQVETPQVILGSDGAATVARIVHAAQGRCSGLHFGTYDYTAGLGVSAAYQSMEHPAADHAKAVMALAVAGTGVRLSDGSTNILPVGQRSDVHAAWALHARLVRRSLERAFYQGWDLHPAQLPTRFLATYLFFRDGLSSVGARLRGYLGGGGGNVLDEPATAQALAGFVRRGVHCGAVSPAEAHALTGVEMHVLDVLASPAVRD